MFPLAEKSVSQISNNENLLTDCVCKVSMKVDLTCIGLLQPIQEKKWILQVTIADSYNAKVLIDLSCDVIQSFIMSFLE